MFCRIKNLRAVRAIALTLIICMVISLMPYTGINGFVAEAANVHSWYALAQKATQNNKTLYEGGSPVDDSYSNLGFQDVFVLEQSGIDTNTWLYDGSTFKADAIELADNILLDPNEKTINWSGNEVYLHSSKRIAYGYLAMKALDQTVKAENLLAVLQGRQDTSIDGSFDGNAFSDIPALEALGRDGALDEIRTASAINCTINFQSSDGSWYSDFMTTAEAVRALKYLKAIADTADQSDIQDAIDNGIIWMQSKQQVDGSFTASEWDDPLVDTAEVIYTLNALGEGLNSWQKNGKGPLDYLLNDSLNGDGSFGSQGNRVDNTWMLDACILIGGELIDSTSVDDGNDKVIPDSDEINVTVKVIGKNNKVFFGPESVTLSSDDKWGISPLGALHNTGLYYHIKDGEDDFVDIIKDDENHGMDGWMYKIEGKISGWSASVEGKLEDGDNVLWFYSTDSKNIAGLDEIAEEEEIVSDINEAKEEDEKALLDAINKDGKAIINTQEDRGDRVYLSPATLNDLAEKETPLTIKNNNISVEFASNSIPNHVLSKAIENENQTTSMEIKASIMNEEEKKDLLEKADPETLEGLFDIGGQIIDLSVNILYSDNEGNIEKKDEIDTFFEPVKVTIKIPEDMSIEEAKKITGIRYEVDEDGNIVPIKLGGTYDPETKTFTFYTDSFSCYGVMKAEGLKKITLKIDEPKIIINDEPKSIDVAPVIIDSRTMVPIRFVSETLGAEVQWLEEERKVVVSFENKKLELIIGEITDPELDVPPVIISDRTMVPIRYISEKLKANVLWVPSNRTVEIVK